MSLKRFPICLNPDTDAAMFLVFAVASRELVAWAIVSQLCTKTDSTFIFNQCAQGSPNEGIALAALAIGLSTLILIRLKSPASP